MKLFCLLVLGFFIPIYVAHADTVTYQLTFDKCSSNCIAGGNLGTGVYADVGLMQEGNNVVVTENLADGEVYAHTGAGNALQFNLSSGTINTATITSGFSIGTPKSIGGVGSFNEAISCSSCGNGTSQPNYSGPLMFTVDGATVSDFTPTSGTYFSSDIGTGEGYSRTGNVLGDQSPTLTATTPEPASLALLGTGMLGLVGVFRRRLAK